MRLGTLNILSRRAATVLVGAWVAWLVETPVLAQVAGPGPPGPFVVDVRGVTSGLPNAFAFYPTITEAVSVPNRGFGVDAGAHAYLFGLGPGRIGIGADVLYTRGTARSTASSTTDDEAADDEAMALPDTRATMVILAPQLSMNWGTAEGWSYISGGTGIARIRTVVRDAVTGDATNDSGWVGSLNVGGGARWFLSTHVAFGFDFRVHRLSKGDGGVTPRVTLTSVAVGISIR